ncbi:MAG TPA: iron-sulfur cluster assembly scaffold protein [Chthoniobacterales bacterium]|jgi:nitrogen fixation NifU-like protein|nr:iron-sulfur cluster assembly scaffold protein [Chthoniobacterales bacterium]
MNPADDFSNRIEEAIKHPKNLGELDGADAVGTVGNEDCGDMLRMWVKFKEVDGKRVIDRATFQTFGCGTAIAVASVATELISGKTVEEALTMSGEDLSAPLGPLPPLKIHCAQLVEEALRSALAPDAQVPREKNIAPTLLQQMQSPTQEKRKVILGPSK